ncbi:LysR substrate-binding domain-containing protein [Bacillus horti]|uniref:DNA-binding transcriptional LysR family regulator n=1 Tax=Caldalkalibacillus horti TaxID=77523 RepID=A0ABT9W0G1_9BACI|nr:LysR substrate-binding domain-containing protein [Bacillus horti]MDQ0166532.1 DNA-binding transcriptional LysR family regulator [Bacillus horti]
MNTRLLRYFIAVAEELNFSRAAKRLNMAQPPLSQQIMQLENEIGAQLFRRNKRMVQLTDAGKVFLKEAQSLLLQMEQAGQKARLAEQGQLGDLRIGFVGSASDGSFVEKIKEFYQQNPSVNLQLLELTSSEQMDALYAKEIDLGLMRRQSVNQTLHSSRIAEEPLVLVLPEHHALASKVALSAEDVAHDRFILFPRRLGPDFYDLIIGFFQSHEVSLNIVQEAIHMHTIVNLVSTGIGIAVVPASVTNFKRPGIVYKNFIHSTPTVGLYATWRKDNDSAVLQSFLSKVLRG